MFAASVTVTRNGIGKVAVGGAASSREADLLTMTKDTFKPLIGSVFHVRNHKSVMIPLLLTSVKESPQAGAPLITEAFTLRFRSLPIGSPLPQGTYDFQHDALGSFPLFIVPSGLGAPRSISAVFNRLQR